MTMLNPSRYELERNINALPWSMGVPGVPMELSSVINQMLDLLRGLTNFTLLEADRAAMGKLDDITDHPAYRALEEKLKDYEEKFQELSEAIEELEKQ